MTIETRLNKLESKLIYKAQPLPEFVFEMIQEQTSRAEAIKAWAGHRGDTRLFILKQYGLI